ncbi:MAG: hypothetical protein CM15mP59_2420 [Flavobacteriaceae bacterium]|nr:MAG: hypothetical protein CM15mP59_2420 [Flavobacteriaceae bacterium]
MIITFKTTQISGKEFTESQLLPLLSSMMKETVLHPYTKHIGLQIGMSLENHVSKNCLVTGGGTHNHFLIDQIKQHTSCRLEIPDQRSLITKRH